MNVVIRTMLGLLGGFGLGILVVIILLALLIVANKASAHEPDVTLVREAPEQSLNYKSSDQIPPTYVLEDHYIMITPLPKVPEDSCETWNSALYARMELIAKYIAQDPKHGYIFKEALLQLHSMWCTP